MHNFKKYQLCLARANLYNRQTQLYPNFDPNVEQRMLCANVLLVRTVCVDINYRQTYNEIPYHYYDILSDDHVANKLLYSLLIQKFFHFFSCPQRLIRSLHTVIL